MRQSWPLAALVTGVAAIAAATLGWAAIDRLPSSPPGHLAAPPDRPTTAAAVSAATEPTAASTSGSPAATMRTQPIAVRSARLADLTPEDEATPPVRIVLPRIGIEAPVVGVGVDPRTRELAVPDDVAVAGWYRHGAAPGDRQGSVVVAAHVDGHRQGKGAFFDLQRAREGDEVRVALADGQEQRYTVASRHRVAKDALPDELFATGGPPRLVLVTCGGAFDEVTQSYRDNVVVVAHPTAP